MLHSEKIMSGMVARKPDAESQQQDAAPEQQEIDPRVLDHAKRILTAAVDRNEISSDQAADAWEAWHQAKTARELTAPLDKLKLPTAVLHELWTAKQEYGTKPDPFTDRLDRTVEAIKRVARLHATPARDEVSVAKLGETHPHVMKALTDAALKSDE